VFDGASPSESTGAQVAGIESFIGDPLLFLVGHTLYKRALSQVIPVYRLAAIGASWRWSPSRSSRRRSSSRSDNGGRRRDGVLGS
jgi:hypothetical protein